MQEAKEQEVAEKPDRKTLRAEILSRRSKFKRIQVTDEVSGQVYELLQPTIAQRSELRKEVTTTGKDGIDFDFFRFTLLAAVRFAVVPGTTERIFEDEDYELLCSHPPGGFVDKLSEVAASLCNVDGGKEEEKDSAKKP